MSDERYAHTYLEYLLAGLQEVNTGNNYDYYCHKKCDSTGTACLLSLSEEGDYR